MELLIQLCNARDAVLLSSMPEKDMQTAYASLERDIDVESTRLFNINYNRNH